MAPAAASRANVKLDAAVNEASANEKDRSELEAKIAIEEANISALAGELDRRRAMVVSLREKLSASKEPKAARATRREKIQLFRSLFRGREDVFARRWRSLKTGKAGYSPACANEWDPLLCAKGKRTETGRKENCADCCHHAFVPVTDEEIEKHTSRATK